MAAPKGNENAKDHDGSNAGRKSAYKENMDARFLQQIWDGDLNEEELEKIITSKKYGAKHIFAFMVLTRDDKMMAKLVDKLFANKQKVEIETPLNEEARDQLDKLNLLINNAKASATTTFSGDSTVEPPSC